MCRNCAPVIILCCKIYSRGCIQLASSGLAAAAAAAELDDLAQPAALDGAVALEGPVELDEPVAVDGPEKVTWPPCGKSGVLSISCNPEN